MGVPLIACQPHIAILRHTSATGPAPRPGNRGGDGESKAMSPKSGAQLPSLFTIATLGSHSALQILKGAKDEGFHTLAVVTPLNERLYSSFAFVDETIVIPRYSDFPKLEREFKKRKIILVPHRSFVAYLSMGEHKAMTTPYLGNKAVLALEV